MRNKKRYLSSIFSNSPGPLSLVSKRKTLKMTGTSKPSPKLLRVDDMNEKANINKEPVLSFKMYLISKEELWPFSFAFNFDTDLYRHKINFLYGVILAVTEYMLYILS